MFLIDLQPSHNDAISTTSAPSPNICPAAHIPRPNRRIGRGRASERTRHRLHASIPSRRSILPIPLYVRLDEISPHGLSTPAAETAVVPEGE